MPGCYRQRPESRSIEQLGALSETPDVFRIQRPRDFHHQPDVRTPDLRSIRSSNVQRATAPA
ncbi:MAG: hypothetical protein N2049_03805, partial [Anaerolineales bacterium]|nr:hypothetical protein [Anaerolineales bacterium]